MALRSGDKLGHYEVISLLGKGGMGEVYRARDTKLKREVAIKFLPEAFARDPDRMARFQREAEVLASLNHPNIATIHGVEDRALVMELVEGNSPKGPLPFDEAWKIASQITAALEYAHERGIMHRDLKPANVLITSEGAVKLLDFGLAKAFSNQRESSASPENSPTLTLAATEVGVVLGTAAYMAPEQARGKNADKRADIWSFGVVLYELLTGERLFTGEDAAETLAAVIHKTPDLDKAPPQVRKLLRCCLEKDPKKRLRDIGDAIPLLDDAPEPALAQAKWVWPGIAALLGLAAVVMAVIHFRETPPAPPELVQFQIALPEKGAFFDGSSTLLSDNARIVRGLFVAVSPDGHRIAFSGTDSDGRSRLWVHSFGGQESSPLLGTEDVSGLPFWSPDSRFLAFGSGGKLKTIDVSGGPAQVVCDAPHGVVGGSWSADGVLIFGSRNSGLRRVAAAGGIASPLTIPRPDTSHAMPSFLPDGHRFIYSRISGQGADDDGIFLGSLDARPEQQPSKPLLANRTGGLYVPSRESGLGYILFWRDGRLMAQPFRAGRSELAGEAVPVADDVGPVNAFAMFAASTNTLAYRNGSGLSTLHLTWFDRTGKVLGEAADPAPYGSLALSPDAQRLALHFRIPDSRTGTRDIWLRDLIRGTNTRFTFDPRAESLVPLWSPDGKYIAFSSQSDAGSPADLYRKPANGGGQQELLLKSEDSKWPNDWSSDGRFLLYTAQQQGRNGLWILPLNGDGSPAGPPKPYLKTEFFENQGQFSPDARFVAYTSAESGEREIYVRPFPDSSGSGKWQISKNGGVEPRWRRDGKELLYFSGRKLMAVDVSLTPTVAFSAPKLLFEAPIEPKNYSDGRHWEIAPDGKRFLIATVPSVDAGAPVTVLLNWQARLGR